MKKFTFMLALIGLLLALSIGIVGAQDEPDAGDTAPVATVEAAATVAPAATLVAVTEDGEVTPVVVTSETPNDSVNIPVWVALIGGALLALGGAAIGGGSVFAMLTRWISKLQGDTNSVKNAELLANGAPEWALKLGYDFARLMQAGGRFIEEVTDGKPVDQKPSDASEWMRLARAAGLTVIPGTDGQFMLVPASEAE